MRFISLLMALRCVAQTQAVDVFYDAHDNATLGTNVTKTVLDNGSRVAATGAWSVSFVNAAFMQTDNTLSAAPYYKFNVSGTAYTGSTTRSLIIDNQYDQSDAIWTPNVQKASCSMGFFWRTDVPHSGSVVQMDFALIASDTGKFAAFNCKNDIWAARMESTLSAVSQFNEVYRYLAGSTYWVTMKFVITPSPLTYISFYDPVSWKLINSTTGPSDSDTYAKLAKFGQDRIGLAAGYHSYFSNVVIDYTNATYPLGVPETPSAPTGLTIGTITGTTIALSWTNADTKFGDIQILRAPHGGAYSIVGSTNSDSGTTFTDSGLQPGVQYDYEVQAHNILFTSSASSSQTATTTATSSTTKLAPGGKQMTVGP